ncbi:MAG: sulfurtransferase TusA family protein [Sphingomonadaceae bacterium]
MAAATINAAPAAARAVEARGLRCPLPALRLARAVREGGPGRYRLLADDPAATHDIPALAAERGWTLLSADAGAYEVEVPPAR